MENVSGDGLHALEVDRDATAPVSSDTQVAKAKMGRNMKKMQFDIDTTERQEQYIAAQNTKGDRLGLVFAKAFLYGMRDIGYKSPGWAFCELVDNSIQAGATTVEVRFGYAPANKSRAKPDMFAVVDNGGGMIPAMISYAVRWGGSDRVGDRHGFGRYGFGLPSASVSMAKRYTVYSKTKGAPGWSAVTVDLDQLADAAEDVKKLEKLLEPYSAELPKWIVNYEADVPDNLTEKLINVPGLASGTVIVLEQIDRLRDKSAFIKDSNWVTTKIVKGKLLDHFGLIYRHWLPERRILVDGTLAQAVDPLFLMPEARYYDETNVMAQQVYDHAFEVETASGEAGVVRIRAAYLPPTFQLANPEDLTQQKNNKRQRYMKALNGLLVCREGRQIDCIMPEWTRFQVYDYNVKIEVDFDPILDEFFGITTSKQQIVIEDSMWEKLKQSGKEAGGLQALVQDLRRRYKDEVDELSKKREVQLTPDQPRPSEVAMEQAEKFRIRRPTPTPEKVEEAKKNVEELIEKITKQTGRSKQEVATEVKRRIEGRSWHVGFDAAKDGPFYWPRRLGKQKDVVINTAHPFYTKLYNRAPGAKSALEVLISVLADGEIDAEGDREHFYRNERVHHWSKLLKDALDKLVDEDAIVDRISAAQEAGETEGTDKAA